MAPQTRKSSARAAMKFLHLISWDLAFLAKSVMIPSPYPHWAHAQPLFSMCGTGVWRLPGTWCAWLPASNTEQMVAETGPVARFQRRGSLAKMGAVFLQTLRNLRLVPTSKTLTEKPCDCGNSASLGFAHHRAHFKGPSKAR